MTTTSETVEPLAAAEQAALSLPEVKIGDLPGHWLAAIHHAGWQELMPVQSRAIPYIMVGQDLMVQSRTGSGKTGAFVLPLLEKINPLQNACQVLILVPTRELALQVTRDAQTLLADRGIRIAAVYGGVRYGPQLDALRAGAHLVVGTAGRVLDHLLRGSLSLESLRLLIFDEADRMLSMGFYPDMKQIRRHMPAHRVESHMFSATFPPFVVRLSKEFLRDPLMLSLSQDQVHVAETEHVFYTVPGMDKDRSLVRLIEAENPTSAIIFCNTKAKVHYVAVVLQRFGYNAGELSADLSQHEREQVMQRVRQGTLRFLVATDVAARGIDIPDLSHVIQYEPPEDPESYIHRAGRTGRAGASGEAITLVDVVEKLKLRQIAKTYQIDLQERPLPTDEDVQQIVAQRATALLEARLRERDKLQTERMQRFVPLMPALAQDEQMQQLMAMLLDDYYHSAVHTAATPPAAEENRPPPRPKRSRSNRRR
ncbi:MAG: DEAD/DEAH box helicase [Anaerolineales bacterium]|nr:DEAD/DEAH box helicase [Anaerolineales bacterium]